MTTVQRRVLLIGAIMAAAVAGALVFEAVLSIGSSTRFGHTRYGHAVGWLGLAVILLVFIYPIRKRYSLARHWPRGWFRVHMVAGILGPLLIFLHSGAHYHALVPVFAMGAMVVVVISGIVGQAVHAYVVRTLNDERRRFQQEGLSAGEIETLLHRVASQEETFRLWQAVHAPMTLMFLVLTALHVAGALFFAGL
ncbi:MAG: conserved rane protein of unknown function [Nitrospira sp.]|nr:conserved rane protein of unknown function [Nitrospira sp.]